MRELYPFDSENYEGNSELSEQPASNMLNESLFLYTFFVHDVQDGSPESKEPETNTVSDELIDDEIKQDFTLVLEEDERPFDDGLMEDQAQHILSSEFAESELLVDHDGDGFEEKDDYSDSGEVDS